MRRFGPIGRSRMRSPARAVAVLCRVRSATCSESRMSPGIWRRQSLAGVAYPESRSVAAADLTVDNVDVVVLGPNESQVQS